MNSSALALLPSQSEPMDSGSETKSFSSNKGLTYFLVDWPAEIAQFFNIKIGSFRSGKEPVW